MEGKKGREGEGGWRGGGEQSDNALVNSSLVHTSDVLAIDGSQIVSHPDFAVGMHLRQERNEQSARLPGHGWRVRVWALASLNTRAMALSRIWC